MSAASVALTTAALLAASSSLYLAGCGASDLTTSVAPATEAVTTTNPAITTNPAEAPSPATTVNPCPGLPEGGCHPNSTHGCLDGVAFEFAKHFACGAKQPPYTRVALYDKDTSSCCAQGIAFDLADHFCCFDGVHASSAGECRAWSNSDSTSCGCYGLESSALGMESAAAEVAEATAVDTLSATPACTCTNATETHGCLNGHPYEFASEMPCGNYIASVYNQGCCPTAEGIKPYSLHKESCCKDGESNVIRDQAHACQCWRAGCSGSIFPTV